MHVMSMSLTALNSLAYAELYLVSAHIIRRFDMRLYNVIRERDVDTLRDAFIGLPSRESKGVRIAIIHKRK